LYVLGYGGAGQFGNDDCRNYVKPTKIEGLYDVSHVLCGMKSTAIIVKHKLYFFGVEYDGHLRHTDRVNGCGFKKLRKLKGIYSVTSASYGYNFMAIIADGELYTFGNNDSGQLGHGDNEKRLRPTKVDGISGVSHMSCGYDNMAVVANRELYTFGCGKNGCLGHGDNKDQLKPKKVEGLHDVTYVSCGETHTAVIADGNLYTFGYGRRGELGHGGEDEDNYDDGIDDNDNDNDNDGDIVNDDIVNDDIVNDNIVNGDIVNDDIVNDGDIIDDLYTQHKPKKVDGLHNVTHISCGDSHTVVVADGELYTFGNGNYGKLGHGNNENQYIPKKVEGIHNVTFVVCSGTRTCLVADGEVFFCGISFSKYIWGYSGGYGGGGYGERYRINNELKFVKIVGPQNVSYISCGKDHMSIIAD
jgi:alpha-tubulin suppressor-like RCC1 family protein